MTTKFGKWQIDPNTGLIKFVDPDIPQLYYEIPLYELDKSSKFLDWIYQILDKNWTNPQDLYDLIRAFRETLGRGVCSGGIDKSIDPKQILSAKFGTKF